MTSTRFTPTFWGTTVLAAVAAASCNLVAGYPDFVFPDPGTGGSTAAVGGDGSGASGGVGGSGAAGGASCTMASDCPGEDTSCQTPTCSDGTCGIDYAAAETSCTEDGGTKCDGEGACVACLASSDCASPQVCKDTACEDVLVWAHEYGDAIDQSADAIDVDSAGISAVAGRFFGTIDFAGTSTALTASGGEDLFVALLDVDGDAYWSRKFESEAAMLGAHVARAASGKVYLATTFFAGDLESFTPDGQDIFLATINDSGTTVTGSVQYGGDLNDSVLALAAYDTVVIGGRFEGDITFLATTLNATGSQGYIAAVDGDTWATHLGGDGTSVVRAVEVDANNRVFAAAVFDNTVEVDGTQWTAAASDSLLVLELSDEDGSLVAGESFDSSADASVEAIRIGSDGTAVIAGTFTGNLSFGGTMLQAVDGVDVFVAKLSTSNAAITPIWALNYDGDDFPAPTDIAVDGQGNIVLLFQHDDVADYGGGSLPSNGSFDVALVKLDADGNHLWSQVFGDDTPDRPAAASVDGDGNIYLVGTFDDQLDFGDPALIATPGGTDAFVAKLKP